MNNIRGFTLVEVLVAAVILFTSISIISVVYSGALLNSQKAKAHLQVSSTLPSILSVIRNEIRDDYFSANEIPETERQLLSCKYRWRGRVESFSSAPEKLNTDTGNFETPEKRFKLWIIELQVTCENSSQTFTFKEVSWLK